MEWSIQAPNLFSGSCSISPISSPDDAQSQWCCWWMHSLFTRVALGDVWGNCTDHSLLALPLDLPVCILICCLFPHNMSFMDVVEWVSDVTDFPAMKKFRALTHRHVLSIFSLAVSNTVFTYIILFNFHSNPISCKLWNHHFIDNETKAQRGEVTVLLRDWDKSSGPPDILHV